MKRFLTCLVTTATLSMGTLGVHAGPAAAADGGGAGNDRVETVDGDRAPCKRKVRDFDEQKLKKLEKSPKACKAKSL